MLVPISEIKINAGRREADPEGVQELVDSISKVGLLNPITIDREHTPSTRRQSMVVTARAKKSKVQNAHLILKNLL